MLIFNFVGLAMLVACYTIAGITGWLIGHTNGDMLIVIAGPLLFICDLLYRRRYKVGPSWSVAAQAEPAWWYNHRAGGQLIFIPIWACGLLWILLGTFRLLWN